MCSRKRAGPRGETMSLVGIAREELVSRAERIAEEEAGVYAHEVDRDARFPVEAFDAMREEGLLSALVPQEFGGAGATLSEVAEMTRAFGAHCSSTALVFAIHNMQVACLVRHGHTPLLRDFLAELAESQLLLGCAAVEPGTGGNLRTSLSALQRSSGDFRLEKHASAISYGAYADAILTTVRRSPESALADQVLVLCRAPGLTLEQTSQWETLGLRGTCSAGFNLYATGNDEQILPNAFSEISATTLLPIAHVLCGSARLGIATAIVERARHFMRAQARKKPGVTPFGAESLAELLALHQQMTELVKAGARHFDTLSEDPRQLETMTFAVAMNNVEVSSSTVLVDIVGRALTICGLAGYRLDSVHSLSRLVRDAHGAALMINSNRVIADTAQMLLIAKEY
jgi:acyl-CoA dehydrogenase